MNFLEASNPYRKFRTFGPMGPLRIFWVFFPLSSSHFSGDFNYKTIKIRYLLAIFYFYLRILEFSSISIGERPISSLEEISSIDEHLKNLSNSEMLCHFRAFYPLSRLLGRNISRYLFLIYIFINVYFYYITS